MNRIIFVGLSLLTLSGCGLSDTANETLSAVREGNNHQSRILEETEKMEKLTEQMRATLNKTAEGVHLQILTMALDGLLSPNNTSVLVPAPLRMIPFARAFAKEATSEELVSLCHLLLEEVHSTGSDSGRLIPLTALSLLAGFASVERTIEIFVTHIERKGRYEETAYALGMARYNSVRDYLFDPIVTKSKILNEGALRESVEHFKSLVHLVRLPYAALFEINIPSIKLVEKIDPADVPRLASKARRRFKQKLDEATLQRPAVQELLKVFENAA